MSYKTYFQKLELLQEYIKNKWANTPDKLAQKLNVSRRTILRMVSDLKDSGIGIEYCKLSKSYKISEN